MSFRNTMKLFASNFTLVWKQVLYFLICLIIFVPIVYSVGRPILHILSENGIGSRIDNLVSSLYVDDFGVFSFIAVIKDSLYLIGLHFSEIWGNILLVILLGFLCPFVVLQISSYNLNSIIYKKLSMNMNVGYIQNMINTLKNSTLYALINVVFRLPFWTVIVLAFELFLIISNTTFGLFFGLIGLQAVLIIVNALKHAFFSNYTTVYIEKDCSPVYAFILALPITIKNFWNIMATSIIFQMTRLVANAFVALFTFFAGLVLMIPATFVLTSIFYTVIYLNKTGQRYYMGNNYIYNPVKYSVKRDEYADKMLDPEEPIEDQYVTAIDSLNKNKKNKKNKGRL